MLVYNILHYVYHDSNIRKPMCQINSLENDFFDRCVSAWNSSPSSLVKSKYSVALFKYNLRFIDLSSFLNYVFRIRINFVFIILKMCNYGFILVVLLLYPVTTKDTFLVLISLFLKCYYFMYLEVLNKINYLHRDVFYCFAFLFLFFFAFCLNYVCE